MQLRVVLICVCGVASLTAQYEKEHAELASMIWGRKIDEIKDVAEFIKKYPGILNTPIANEPSRHKGQYPIFILGQNSLEYVKELFKQVPEFKNYLNQQSKFGVTPLLSLANKDVMEFFIDQGANVNEIQKGNEKSGCINGTILHYVIGSYFNMLTRAKWQPYNYPQNVLESALAPIELLLKKGASPQTLAQEIKVEGVKQDPVTKQWGPDIRAFRRISAYGLAKELGMQDVVNLMKKYDTAVGQLEIDAQKRESERSVYRTALAFDAIAQQG